MELTLLGTGCPSVDHKRYGPSNLVTSKKAKILIDCGSGVTQRLNKLKISDQIDNIGNILFELGKLLLILNFLLTKTFKLYFRESNTKKLYKFSILPTEYLELEINLRALFLLT